MRGPIATTIGLSLLVMAPIIAAVASTSRSRWYPVLDMAQTELRLRDVWSSHPPLIGLGGRLGPLGEQGSHPGPLSFIVLWPFYQLFGASAWAMQAAAACMHGVAVAAALVIARRRGGPWLAAGLALGLAVLVQAYGLNVFIEPWNPYLPVSWWMLLLLATWSVLEGDAPFAPVAVFAGSFCAQTHISYLPPVGALFLVVFVAGVVRWRRSRADRRRWLRSGLAALVTALVLWTPPLVDELLHSPSNLERLRRHFSDPPEAPVGVGEGLRLLLAHLDPGGLLRSLSPDLVVEPVAAGSSGSSPIPGILLVAVASAAAVIAVRLRLGALFRLLCLLTGVSLVTLVTMARIFGPPLYYLGLFAWGTTVLLLVAIAWALIAWAARFVPRNRSRRATVLAAVALGCGLAAALAASVVAGSGVELRDRRASRVLAELAPDTIRSLRRASGGADATDRRYLVTFGLDSMSIGAQGFGMVNELERAGLDVGIPPLHNAGGTRHRVRGPADADVLVEVAVGEEIARAERRAGSVRVAYADVRTPSERREFAALRAEVIDGLRSAGVDHPVDAVERLLFVTTLDPRVPLPTRERMLRMLEIGVPAAVFVSPR